MNEAIYTTISRVLNIILGFINVFLVLRIIFRLLGANPNTLFVSWIYNISDNLTMPFSGIFPIIPLTPAAEIDTVAFVALLFYTLFFYLVIRVLYTLIPPRDRLSL